VRRPDDALGLLEVRGMTAAVGAADAMSKSAPIRLGPAVRIGDGLVTIPIHGEIAAVREALIAGTRAGMAIGMVVASHAIGRPVAELIDVFGLATSRP
jgi:microcompartment protein CcmL/EutN